MAVLGTFTKQPREVLDFDINYSTVLAGRVDTVFSKIVEVTPVGLTISSSSISDNKIKVVIAGGSAGTLYKVTVLATTAPAALTYEDEVNILVEEV